MRAFNDTVLHVKIAISSAKKTKQQCKLILDLNSKCIESKHFIHYLKRFPQTLSACFVMPSTSKHNYQTVFSYSCPKCQSLNIFKNHWLFPMQTFISLVLHFPFTCKWPRQEAKTKQQQNRTTLTTTRSQECLQTNCHQPMRHFLAGCHRDFELIG